jgi:uncharacterized nucleotidyltransferase DUF6036
VDRDEILSSLRAVGAHLDRRGLRGDLYVVGGAALALAYDARRTTRDVDAVFEPKMEVYAAAATVAEERGLPPGWLNDAVKGFLVGPDPFDAPVIELPGLRVQAASPQMLLALKVIAHRLNEDRDDVRLLAGMLGLATADEVLDLVEELAGPRLLTPQAQFFVEVVMQPDGS